MRLYMYSVLDRKAGVWLPPFYFRSSAEACRSFVSTCADGNSSFAKFPEDFALYVVGVFDDVDCSIQGLEEGPRQIMSAHAAVAVFDRSLSHGDEFQTAEYDEARVQPGAESGNSAKSVRQKSQLQDDV